MRAQIMRPWGVWAVGGGKGQMLRRESVRAGSSPKPRMAHARAKPGPPLQGPPQAFLPWPCREAETTTWWCFLPAALSRRAEPTCCLMSWMRFCRGRGVQG